VTDREPDWNCRTGFSCGPKRNSVCASDKAHQRAIGLEAVCKDAVPCPMREIFVHHDRAGPSEPTSRSSAHVRRTGYEQRECAGKAA
jgi:hypothetical protein